MQEFLTLREAARLLAVDPRTLDKWRHEGAGPVYRKHGRRVVYHRADLIAWSESRRRVSTADDGSGAGCGVAK
jgi:excisionase family DNA binding protein